jgi:hypothetical protein
VDGIIEIICYVVMAITAIIALFINKSKDSKINITNSKSNIGFQSVNYTDESITINQDNRICQTSNVSSQSSGSDSDKFIGWIIIALFAAIASLFLHKHIIWLVIMAMIFQSIIFVFSAKNKIILPGKSYASKIFFLLLPILMRMIYVVYLELNEQVERIKEIMNVSSLNIESFNLWNFLDKNNIDLINLGEFTFLTICTIFALLWLMGTQAVILFGSSRNNKIFINIKKSWYIAIVFQCFPFVLMFVQIFSDWFGKLLA